MRIVQLVRNLQIGGLERLAVDLARAQKAAGHEPAIYCLEERGAFADQVESSGIRVTAFQKGPGMSPATVFKIARQLRRDRPDILHGHNHLVHHYAVAAAKLAGVPVVANTRHGEQVRILEKPDGTGFYRTNESPDKKADMIFRAALRWTNALIFISEDTRRFYIRNRGISPRGTYVILNGAPLEQFLARPAAPGSVRPKFRFGTAGRMVPEKDHLMLLEAFAIVRQTLPEAELHFAGGGPLMDRMTKRVAELNLSEKVFLHGPLFDMAGYLSSLDAFVLSSLSEGLPIAILEAMAAKLPIVSTRVAGVPEAAPEGTVATYAPIGDAPGLAAAMIQTARDPQAAARGATACDLVCTQFTIERMWKDHETLFQSLMAAGSRRAS
ncbi:MAG: glycosyltransferase [Acidobacteriota bacterium]|nr:glycosyltransferase [Acidobacteriota bacterium]